VQSHPFDQYRQPDRFTSGSMLISKYKPEPDHMRMAERRAAASTTNAVSTLNWGELGLSQTPEVCDPSPAAGRVLGVHNRHATF
jgi:hypothetical protein